VSANPAASVAHDDDARVREFLADSLALWRVAGTVEAGESPVVAVIRAGADAIVWVERPAQADMPFRWLVRSRSGGSERARPCASLVGLLNGIRSVLGVERGDALRIAPGPPEE
jgi:hypothetical protein